MSHASNMPQSHMVVGIWDNDIGRQPKVETAGPDLVPALLSTPRRTRSFTPVDGSESLFKLIGRPLSTYVYICLCICIYIYIYTCTNVDI